MLQGKAKQKKRIRKVDKRTITHVNPQQTLFLNLYTNPKSETFGNAYRSALLAGFSENYASQILSKPHKWLKEIDRQLGDERRLMQAERNFTEYQQLDVYNGGDKLDSGILAVKLKNDMFLAERLDKAKYSTRTENAVLVKVEHVLDDETRKRLDALL